jgi:hypothetical protein
MTLRSSARIAVLLCTNEEAERCYSASDIVNLRISPDELFPLRGFMGFLVVILHEKTPKNRSSSPLFRKNNLIMAVS